MTGMITLSMVITPISTMNAATDDGVDQSSSHDDLNDDKNSNDSPENLHKISLDTLDVDGGGNWLEKRIWYERAQSAFDEIRVIVSQVSDLRLQFSNEVNAIGHKIDAFYEVVYFEKGQLDDKFKEILANLETEQKFKGDLSEEERQLQRNIKEELHALEQISSDFKSIGDIDEKINQTLVQAFKTIEECRDYETKSWDAFKSIGKELDDKKASSTYYQMNNFKQNVDQKNSYLKSTLLPYLHNVLIAKIETNIARINESIEQLKKKGIDLQAIMSKTQENDLEELHNREKKSAEIAVSNALEDERAKENEEMQKIEKALAKAKKQSFSYVIQQYYDASIGPVVTLFKEVYQIIKDSFFGGYITQAVGIVKLSTATIFENIMSFFEKEVEKIQEGEISIASEGQEIIDELEKPHDENEALESTVPNAALEKTSNSESPEIVDPEISNNSEEESEDQENVSDTTLEKDSDLLTPEETAPSDEVVSDSKDQPDTEFSSEETEKESDQDESKAAPIDEETESSNEVESTSEDSLDEETPDVEAKADSDDENEVASHDEDESDDVVVQGFKNKKVMKPILFIDLMQNLFDFIWNIARYLFSCTEQFLSFLLSFILE